MASLLKKIMFKPKNLIMSTISKLFSRAENDTTHVQNRHQTVMNREALRLCKGAWSFV